MMGECLKCGACCKFVAFTVSDMTPDRRDYYQTKGFRVEGSTILIPHISKQLNEDNTCKVHDNKPKICAEFTGQKEGYVVPRGCGYEESTGKEC